MLFIIITSISILAISLIIMHHSVWIFNIKQMTIPGFFYLTYIIFIFLPSIAVALDKQPPYRDAYFFAVASVMLTVPFGIIAMNMIFRFKKKEIKAFFSKSIEESPPSFYLQMVFLLCLVGALSLTVLYISQVNVVPLFKAFKDPGAYTDLVQAREQSFKLLDSPLLHLYFWLRVLIYPFLTIQAFGYYLWTKRRLWLLYFIVCLVAGLFYAGLSLAKWPVVVIFLIIFLFYYVYSRGCISKTIAILLIGLMSAFPIFVIMIITSGTGVTFYDAVRAVIARMFLVPAEGIYYYFEIFPEKMDYLFGRSIGKLSMILGWEHFNLTNYVFQYRFPSRIESGSANAGFISALHADFGLCGVILGGVGVGMLMQFIQIRLIRRKKTVFNLSAYSFLIFGFFLLSFSALPVVLMSNGVVIVLMLLWVIGFIKIFSRSRVHGN